MNHYIYQISKQLFTSSSELPPLHIDDFLYHVVFDNLQVFTARPDCFF